MNIPALQELLARAQNEGWALPHFNFSSLSQLHGIIDALKETNSPAMVGTSEKERDFFGMKEAVEVVKGFREEGIAVYLNADHCLSVESAIEAFEAGYDSVHIDLSRLSLEENTRGVGLVVSRVKKQRPEVQVEGELGYLQTSSSKVYKEAIDIPEESYTKTSEAKEFVRATGVDRFAPAVGTIHGIAANDPLIRFQLVKELKAALGAVPLVLHGGSGVSAEDLQQAVLCGIANVHISTELRIAYAQSIKDAFARDPDALAPYEYLKQARKETAAIVKEKVGILGSAGKVA